MLEEGRKLAVAVRDVNRKYARQVEDLVPENKKAVIADEVKRQSFPRVYNETRTERLVKAAKGMGDLSDDQKTAIETLDTAFTRDMTSLNDQLAKAQEQMEMTITAENMMSMFRGGDEGPMGELYKKRRELGNKTEDELRKVLSQDQQRRLPNVDEDNGPGGGRRRGGQGGNDNGAPQPRGTPRQNRGGTT